ncbi:archaea-specific SMC-related protein [Halobellus captivus]|uniref:archaea-specific SMC-related protein n=1 Tax=Halobellus captivus TaxID=2592614 RepID=UPI0011A26710|nr:archaea-specific SMC-related protein [Halobellus captivus]
MPTDQMKISVSNIGGIDETKQTFEPGVSILAGRNATNRTSFLQAVMAGFGSTQASLKADADEGFVELMVDGESYTRTLTRSNGGVTYGGDPYLDDAEVADLFAFLIESNEARLAVSRDEELRDVIMRPVDTEVIQTEIRELEQKKREVDSKTEELESLKNRLPKLQERLTQRQMDIETKEEELAKREAELDELDQGLKETREEKNEVEETFSELREARQELEDLQYKLETEQESLESLKTEREDLQDALEQLETGSKYRIEELNAELSQLRSEKQALEAEISTLQQVIQFNEDMLDGSTADIAHTLQPNGGANAESVTDQLVTDTEVVCWTCSSRVEQSAIEETVDDLRSLLSGKHSEVRELEDEIGELKSEKESIEVQQERAEDVSRRRHEVEEEIEEREEAINELENLIMIQSEKIEQLEAEAEAVEDEDYGEILDAHKEVNQLGFELDRLHKEVEEIKTELAEVNDQVAKIGDLQDRRETITSELNKLRTKIERLEEGAVEAFNDHMADILGILEYENVERIWLERTTREVRNGRQKETKSVFELHIIRSMPDGTTYEDTVDHLSESEREVTGLIFALAGYLVHNVYETLPVMLLDSLEAIDSDRITELVHYFEQYADYLFVALLSEDAMALDGQYPFVKSL